MGWPKIIVHLEVEVINFFLCVCVKIISSQIVTKIPSFFSVRTDDQVRPGVNVVNLFVTDSREK